MNTHLSTDPSSMEASLSKLSLWESMLYTSEMTTGSYLHMILSFPMIPDNSFTASAMTVQSGTLGSRSLPYGVMVTWNDIS